MSFRIFDNSTMIYYFYFARIFLTLF